MRKLFFFLVIFSVFNTVHSQTTQTNTSEDTNIYNSSGVEVIPQFPGGITEFYKFIGSNFKTPNFSGLKGKLIIAFVINIDGSLTDIKIVKDIGYGTGIEAIRVLNLSPKWKPGEQNGQTVRCSYLLPINIEAPK